MTGTDSLLAIGDLARQAAGQVAEDEGTGNSSSLALISSRSAATCGHPVGAVGGRRHATGPSPDGKSVAQPGMLATKRSTTR